MPVKIDRQKSKVPFDLQGACTFEWLSSGEVVSIPCNAVRLRGNGTDIDMYSFYDSFIVRQGRSASVKRRVSRYMYEHYIFIV